MIWKLFVCGGEVLTVMGWVIIPRNPSSTSRTVSLTEKLPEKPGT